jgi:hypothetical protein
MRTEFEKELMERVIRLESRMVQLGDHVGANLRTKQRIDINICGADFSISIDSLDVSLSRIYAELHARIVGMPTAAIPVYHNDKLVMMVYP